MPSWASGPSRSPTTTGDEVINASASLGRTVGALGQSTLITATGPIPSLGLDPSRGHVQPDHPFVDLGHRRWRQIQGGRQRTARYRQQDSTRVQDRSEPLPVAVLDEPASRDVSEPERASWESVRSTDARRARRSAPSPKQSKRHMCHPSPKARRRCRVIGQPRFLEATVAPVTELGYRVPRCAVSGPSARIRIPAPDPRAAAWLSPARTSAAQLPPSRGPAR